ncbi:hypothetical protein GDO81_001835 [Engystomops pustulosus]|uniref:Immunoglobulin V-set domain-containing protein n=1 Tax=Engystomops pustulosus TaxID=76066 RepID=A0AAV7DHF8_ENGPU|nr:hypothetical protein GDO81_001835 [Engystomops pustulosus]
MAGEDFTLRCDHASLPTSDYIHWYRVFSGQGPVYLIGGYSDTNSPNHKLRLTFNYEPSQILLPFVSDLCIFVFAFVPPLLIVQQHGINGSP